MNRKVRCIIVACMALCAMAGLASAAQAAKFHAESSPTFLLGNQSEKNVFTVNGKTVECTTAKFESEFTGTELAKLEKVHPTYTGCTAFGLEATVKTTGCTYTFNEPTGTSSPYSGTVSIVCETGHEIEIEAGFGICHVKVGSQSNRSSVTYTDEGTGATRSVLVKANVSGITSTVSGSEAICGANGTQSATYKGSVLAKGYSNATHTTQHGIWVQ